VPYNTLGVYNSNPYPYLKIDTGDKTLNNASAALFYTCTSTLST